MRVEIGERETQFDDLRNDSDIATLIDQITRRRGIMLPLLIELIRLYKTDLEFRNGIGGQRPDRYAASYIGRRRCTRAESEAARRLVSSLGTLFRRYAGIENLLRGFLVEMLVKHALRSRYAASGADILEDNVKFAILNGTPYESRTTIDVIGYERARNLGEVHDCKLSATGWKKAPALAWARELEGQVAPRGIRVGFVTITARDRAKPILEDLGIGRASELIPLERIWELAPLQK
jgi:hypothetical protein